MVFGLSKGWCVFFYCFGTVIISCLSTLDLYCLLDLFVLSLLLWSCISLEIPYLGMNRGHLFHNLSLLS